MSEFPRDPARHRLFRLTDLDDDKVAGREPDVRGWDLYDEEGTRLGQVEELIVDADARRVRYLDVELDLKFARTDNVVHRLVPVGLARLDEQAHHVLLNRTGRDGLLRTPAYSREDPVEREYEMALRRAYAPADPSPGATTTGFYDHDLYDHDRL